MIEATHRKLREARFFHRHLMDLRHGRSATYEPEAFGFYFNAFISAARSVTWVLENEEKDTWEAWKPTWEATFTDEIDELLSITNRERQHPAYGMHQSSQPGSSVSAKVMRRAYYLEQKNGKEEMTEIGERYLNFLEKVVQEFERYSNP
jgi:hypothetical protein